MLDILIENVRLFDPGAGVDFAGRNVAIQDGKLQSLDAPAGSDAKQRFDGRGRLLVPGLIDLRVHTGEPGHTRRETTRTAVQAAAAGGYTAIVAMPTTEPTIDRVEVVELILARAREAGRTLVLPAGALSVDRQGKRLAEMAKLKAAGCVLFTDGDRAVTDSQLLRYAMETALDLGVTVVTHAEDTSLSLGGVAHEGRVATRMGLAGIPGAAEVVGVSRDVAIAQLTGARLHIGHVSTGAAAEQIRQAKRRAIRVTAEVSPLHLLLTDERITDYDSWAKLLPPLRPKADVEAMVGALADGTIDCVASDHTPQVEMEKNLEFEAAAAGAIGLETTLAVCLGLVRSKKLTLERAIACLTRGPAQVLGRPDLGTIKEGGRADLCLIDLEREWRFDRSRVFSKSYNTPLMGLSFVGGVDLTIAGGQVSYALEQA